MRHVERGAASSTADCSIPVSFVQKSLSLGLSVGITNCLRENIFSTMCAAVVRKLQAYYDITT